MSFSPLRGSCAGCILVMLLAGGCGWYPKSQLTKLQNENRRLSEQTKAQLAEIENLHAHSREVEDRLLSAEEELAAFDETHGRASRQLANLSREREQLRRGMLPGGRPIPMGISGQLADLSQRYPSLHFDAETGIAKLDTNILFDSGEANLKPGAVKLLGEFARVLNSQEAQDLKVMVVGHTDNRRIRGGEARERYPNNWHLSTARALAVADQLRVFGLSGDRMGVAGFGQHQAIAPNNAPDARQENRRVEIFVMSPDVPVVGMTETLTNLY